MVNYLERCVDTAGSIDSIELSDLMFGEVKGHGYFFDFRRLGSLTIRQADQDVGLKIPNTHWTHAKTRVIREVAFIGLAAEASPELLTYVPSFINLVSVEDSPALAVLTEDATKNGSKDIEGMEASDATRQMLYKPFRELGSESSIIDGMACLETIAFNVGDRERLLDFDPLPIQLGVERRSGAYNSTQALVKGAINDLTVTIPRNSRLGEALHGYIQ